MRAKDLTIGTEYFYCRSNDWEDGYEEGTRAVVVDPTPGNWVMDRTSQTWRFASRKGQEVLVDVYQYGNDQPTRRPVRTQQLRGLWQECKDKRVQARAARAEAVATESAAHRARIARCEETVALLGELGIQATVVFMGGVRVTISHEAAPKLTAAARQLRDTGWKGAAA